MVDRPASADRRRRLRTRLLVGAGSVVLAALAGTVLLSLLVDWLWYGALGYRDVFRTVLLTRLAVFAVVGLLVGAALGPNLALALRHRPSLPTGPADPLTPARTIVSNHPRLVAVGVAVLVGCASGSVAQGDWRTVLLFWNGTGFGVTDPEFGLDIGFYAFTLPLLQAALGWLLVAAVTSLVGAAAVYAVLGALRLTGRGIRSSPAATRHLAALAGVIALLLAAEYFLDRYELLYSQRSPLFDGATYTDLYAVLPAKLVLTALALICALAFLAGALRRDARLPVTATALLVLSAILVGWAWPSLLQQLSVDPNANRREATSIGRNIEATRQAYGLTDDKLNYVDYTEPASPGTTTAARLAAESATTSNIRVMDPAILEPTFTQLQQRENFYGFPDELDVDRYRAGGELQDYVVAVRELETASLAGNQQSWINQHLRYTHGDGFVAARADRVDSTIDESGGTATNGGYPVFTVSDTTGDGAIPVDQPRVYYGELIDSYVVVGGDPGDPAREFELDGTAFTYDGAGGVPLGEPWQRAVFAAWFGERNILFNEAIGEASKVLFRQDPLQRVEAAAPWLTVDGDPYPAVVDGRIVWIVDGYTTLDRYPYAQQTELGDSGEVGYVRNSVKATVDAYDGTVTLYATDPTDPVLRAWMGAFPGTVQPAAAISDELRAHFRYPQDLFEVQRQLLARYHVDDPGVFFSTNDFWSVPADPTPAEAAGPPAPVPPAAPGTAAPPAPAGPAAAGPGGEPEPGSRQPPHYVLAGPPAAEGPARFQLTSPLVGLRRQFLAAHVSVSSAPGSYGEITVLRLPGDSQTLGPQQVQTRFRSSAEVSQELNILQAAETDVRFGNLLTLPTGDGTLLYVEPVYIERTDQEVSFPQLSRVLVLYGDRVGYAPSLAEALSEAAGPGGAVPGAPPPAAPTPPGGPAPPAAPADPATGTGPAAQAAADVVAALERLRQAKAAGDLAAEGEALIALDEAARRFTAVTGQEPAAAAAPAPGAASTPG